MINKNNKLRREKFNLQFAKNYMAKVKSNDLMFSEV